VRDDGFLLMLRLLCKPREHILSQGDKHPIFRGQVPLLFDSDPDPDPDPDLNLNISVMTEFGITYLWVIGRPREQQAIFFVPTEPLTHERSHLRPYLQVSARSDR
jgi:hypothetical protein